MNKKVKQCSFFVLIIILSVFVYNYFNVDEVSSREVSLKDIKDLPAITLKILSNGDMSTEEYKKKIKVIKSAEVHRVAGEQLYQLAFSKHMYSRDKLSMLQMAKEHLLYSKKIMGDNK